MRFSDKATLGMTAALLAICTDGLALARKDAPLTPAGALHAANQRHENFEELGKTFKQLKEELAKPAPDKALAVNNTARIDDLAQKLPAWFPKGSGKEVRPESEALEGVWSDPAGFGAAATKLQGETAKLRQIATAGDIDAIRIQFQATGQACGACHKIYREKKAEPAPAPVSR